MKTPKPTPDSRRKIDSAIGVRKEVAKRFSTFCKARGLEIGFMAEQALDAWMRAQARSEGK